MEQLCDAFDGRAADDVLTGARGGCASWRMGTYDQRIVDHDRRRAHQRYRRSWISNGRWGMMYPWLIPTTRDPVTRET